MIFSDLQLIIIINCSCKFRFLTWKIKFSLLKVSALCSLEEVILIPLDLSIVNINHLHIENCWQHDNKLVIVLKSVNYLLVSWPRHIIYKFIYRIRILKINNNKYFMVSCQLIVAYYSCINHNLKVSYYGPKLFQDGILFLVILTNRNLSII